MYTYEYTYAYTPQKDVLHSDTYMVIYLRVLRHVLMCVDTQIFVWVQRNKDVSNVGVHLPEKVFDAW